MTEFGRDHAATVALVEWAVKLFAVDPAGTGLCIRARPGPQREHQLAVLRGLMGTRPWRKMPAAITDDRLLGGLDLAATLAAGRPVAEEGLLASADGGAILVLSAERLSAALAARIAAVHDSGEIRLERDGLTRISAARVGLVLVDEGIDDDEHPHAALLDRTAFRLDLSALPMGEIGPMKAPAVDIAAIRTRLAEVTAGDDAIEALCAACAALGIGSLRAPLLALRAAKAAAALDGRSTVSEADFALAAQLVLAWRATVIPQGEVEEADADELADAEVQDDAEDDASGQREEKALDDVVLAAARAALPADLLAKLIAERASGNRHGLAGRAGAAQKSGRRGRRIGIARGNPRGGARLDLIATLRAAAPWQQIRTGRGIVVPDGRQAEPGSTRLTANSCLAVRPMDPGSNGRGDGGSDNELHLPTDGQRLKIQIRPADFRTIRFAERRETLTIFAVDASGSLAINRLAEAKGAVELLLADCYIRRDQVALVAFRGRRADLLLPPTRSLVRAKRCLSGLPGGGGTPLAAGIDAAAALAQAALQRGQTPLIVMLTDGRANVSREGQPGRPRAQADAVASAKLLCARGVKSLLIDTSPQPEPRADALAVAMGALYLHLPHVDARIISRAVKGAWAGQRTPGHG